MPGFDTITQDAGMILADLALTLLLAVLALAAKWIQTHTSAKRFALLTSIGRAAVAATQQVAKRHGLDDTAKFIDAAARIRVELSTHGLTLSDKQVETLIERAVRELKALDATFLEPLVVAGDLTGGEVEHV